MICATAREAAELVQDGWTVACAGFVGAGHPDAVTAALEARFQSSGRPRDLTLVYAAGQGDRAGKGVNHFGNEGMVRRIVGGHWTPAPRLTQLVARNAVETYNWTPARSSSDARCWSLHVSPGRW